MILLKLRKNKVFFLYIVWGILSAALNIGLFQLLLLFKINYQMANGFTLIIVKIFCYVTNKLFVFRTPFIGVKHFFKELFSFFLARAATFVIDFFGVTAMVELCGYDAFLSKCVISAAVIILNYFLSRKFVFIKHAQ